MVVALFLLAVLTAATYFSKTVRHYVAHGFALAGSGVVALGETLYHVANLLDEYEN